MDGLATSLATQQGANISISIGWRLSRRHPLLYLASLLYDRFSFLHSDFVYSAFSFSLTGLLRRRWTW